MKQTLFTKALCGATLSMVFAQTAEAAKTFNVIMPDEREWQIDTPMLSYTENGEKKSIALLPVADRCGWFQATFDKAPKDAIIGLKHNPNLKLGINGLWDEDDEPNPIDLQIVFDAYAVDAIYFIPDDIFWPDQESAGWYATYPEVEGICQFNLAAVIYDTDQSINTLFSFDESSALDSCSGLQKGIVKTDLGEDNKPVFSGSDNAKKCFSTESQFKTLFNYTKSVNEMQCYDLAFHRDQTDARWTFDSSPLGGFFPVENTTDSTVLKKANVSMGPTADARTKRATELVEGTRNQQFCAESHTTFTYYENVEFSFSNTDDMWVFVNKKLAIDKGGLNVTEPVNLELKSLNTIFGNDFLKPGEDYPLDVFYCNRRSAAPNFSFKANIFTKRNGGVDLSTKDIGNGKLQLDICYEYIPADDCSGVTLDKVTPTRVCPEDALTPNIKYSLTTRQGNIPEDCESCKELPHGQVSFGGIDLTNPVEPIITPSKMTGLSVGEYRLNIDISGKKTFYRFNIGGTGFDAIPARADVAQSTFSIRAAGPRQFTIVTDRSNLAKNYAVMDLQGRIVRQGMISSAETLVQALLPGTYVVKIGASHKIFVAK